MARKSARKGLESLLPRELKWVGHAFTAACLLNNVAPPSVAINVKAKGRTKMVCIACGKASKGYAKCWSCRSKEEREQAYDLGYQAGFLKGQEVSPLQLDVKRWRQLMQLCHPDKHSDSDTSKDVAQWLREVKPGD